MRRLQMTTLIGLATVFFASNAFCQECPPSVDVTESPKAVDRSWTASSVTAEHLLSGVDIIIGDLIDANGRNFIQAPQSLPRDEYLWKFKGPVGSDVVWMRCTYHKTRITLARRIDSTATECRQKDSPGSRGVTTTKAYCGTIQAN